MTEPDPNIGRTLDKRYRVDRLIGRGGMGAVYAAHHVGLDRRVAVKFILGSDANARARFKREARAASKIDHDHVVHIYDVGIDETGADFIAMEFVEGTDLKQALKAGPFELSRALHVAKQVVAGLGAVHEAGIVHRDIKPANIMLTNSGERDFVKIMDFGISKAVERTGTAITLASHVIGTPQYMAPEQLMGHEADPRSDLYSAALVIYEMLAGAPPFHGANTDQLVERTLADPPRRLDEVNPALPIAVARVIDRALDKVPSQRYQTADAFLAALDLDGNVGRLESLTVPARQARSSVTTGPQTRPTQVEGRRRIAAPTAPSAQLDPARTPAKTTSRWPLVLAALLILGVPLGVFLAMRGNGAPSAPQALPRRIALAVDDAAVAPPSAADAQLAVVADGNSAEPVAPQPPKPPRLPPSSHRTTPSVPRDAGVAGALAKPLNRAPTNRAESCLCELRDSEGYTTQGCRALASKETCSCGGRGVSLLCRVPWRVDENDTRYCDPPNDVWSGVKSRDKCSGFDGWGTEQSAQIWCQHCAYGTFAYAGKQNGDPCAGYSGTTGNWETGTLYKCGKLPEKDWR